MLSDGKSKIYTFYSYKGGVGRSMAMANVAELLYREGLRVLMVDFDLEAPGLEQYFYRNDEPEMQKVLCKRGLIDLLFSYKSLRSLRDSGLSPERIPGLAVEERPASDAESSSRPSFAYPVEPLAGFITTIYPALPTKPGSLSLITAGRRAKEELMPDSREKQMKDEFAAYANRVRAFAWDDFYLNWDGEVFFDWFREEAIGSADIVLIDSRTGVAEMSGVCTYQLADVVILFAAPNNQNVDGIKKVAHSLNSSELIKEGRKGRALSLVLVPSRVDVSEKAKVDELAARFREMADKLIDPVLRFETNSFDDLKIPYIPYYSFVEEVTVHDSGSSVASDLRKAYEKICRSLAQLDPKVAEKLKLKDEPAGDAGKAELQNRAAERAYDQLLPEERKPARSLLTRLVRLAQVEEGELKDSPKTVKVTDLNYEQRDVAKKLSDAGVLIFFKDAAGQNNVGLADEALIQNWFSLQKWIAEDHEFLLWRQGLQSALSIWEKDRRRDSDLLVESKLDEAHKWRRLRSEDLNEAELGYIDAGSRLQRRKVMRGIAQVVAAMLALASLTLSLYYLSSRTTTSANPSEVRSRLLASNSEALVALQSDVGTLLAVEALRIAPTTEARKALINALQQSRLRTVIRVGATVYSARYSHDGKLIVTANGGGDSVAQVWQQNGDERWQNLIPPLSGHAGDVTAAVFSPDDKTVATSSYDTTAMLWNAGSGAQTSVFKAGRGSLTDAAFNRDGTLLATSSMDNHVYVWSVKSKRLFMTLTGFTDNVNCVSFSPDGGLLAAGSNDYRVRVWNVATGNEVTRPLIGNKSAVLGVAFNGDGSLLVSTGDDGTARVWSTSDWRSVTVFSGHSGPVRRASFSPDGQLVVTAGEDGTAMIWEALTGKRVAVLRGSTGPVNDASFSSDGKVILTAGADGMARLWDSNVEVNPNAAAAELISFACTRVTRNLTQDEWHAYMGSDPYRLTCPDIPAPQPSSTPAPSPPLQTSPPADSSSK
jgi:WD40 repeat protein/MinD-like ATPase involved in chromosome partitioning or flagellar assembly